MSKLPQPPPPGSVKPPPPPAPPPKRSLIAVEWNKYSPLPPPDACASCGIKGECDDGRGPNPNTTVDLVLRWLCEDCHEKETP